MNCEPLSFTMLAQIDDHVHKGSRNVESVKGLQQVKRERSSERILDLPSWVSFFDLSPGVFE
jgi:hypothetical protein